MTAHLFVAGALSMVLAACSSPASTPTVCQRLADRLAQTDEHIANVDGDLHYNLAVSAFVSPELYDPRDDYSPADFERERRACIRLLAPSVIARIDRIAAPRALRAWATFMTPLARAEVDAEVVMPLLEPPRDGAPLQRDAELEARLAHLRLPVPTRLEMRAEIVAFFLDQRGDDDASWAAWQRRLASPVAETRLAAVAVPRMFRLSAARERAVDLALERLRDDPDPAVAAAVRSRLEERE